MWVCQSWNSTYALTLGGRSFIGVLDRLANMTERAYMTHLSLSLSLSYQPFYLPAFDFLSIMRSNSSSFRLQTTNISFHYIIWTPIHA